jgi:hypothetical protein
MERIDHYRQRRNWAGRSIARRVVDSAEIFSYHAISHSSLAAQCACAEC